MRIALALLLLPVAHAAPARALEKPRLLVMEPRLERGIDPTIRPLLDPVVIDAFTKTGRFNVVGRSELALTLEQATQAQLAGCEDALSEACLTELGGALGARFLATLTIGVLGEKYVVSIKVVDVQVASTRRWSAETVATEAVLAATLRRGVHELLPPDGPKPLTMGLGIGAGAAALLAGAAGLVVLSNAGTMAKTTDRATYVALEADTRAWAIGVNVGVVLAGLAALGTVTTLLLPE